MNCLVINDLQDNINIGAHFLKDFEVCLQFSKNAPLTLHFNNYGSIDSVASLKQKPKKSIPANSSLPNNSKQSNSYEQTDSAEISTKTSVTAASSNKQQPVNYNTLQGKLFNLRSSKKQFLAKNTVGQVKCFVDGAPVNDNCFLVMPSNLLNTHLFGGLIKRIKAPHSEFFEYKTLERPIQLDQNEIVGTVLFLDYELNMVKELPFENNDNGDFDKYFEYLDSSLPNPLETIQNSNLFEGGTASAIQNINLFDGGQASVKEGFQIKTEADKKDLRPLEEQLGLNTN